MTVLENGDIVLLTFQRDYLDYVHVDTYSTGELRIQSLIFLWDVACVDSTIWSVSAKLSDL